MAHGQIDKIELYVGTKESQIHKALIFTYQFLFFLLTHENTFSWEHLTTFVFILELQKGAK